ncbi:MAG TPA: phosphoadenosine phosphosulfate reductase family protein [Puia sp.]|jgi:3'-phosphoadenosine 5'-phosphosulfate sulfotransferase (PAPS reductase)/FAD synthetase|nr:phosphoadenosine phosphosulfate reductase family protein [Puia sp.]
MSKKTRHVLGISGGKDSAALAIYLHDKYPELEIEYYCCDTGKELSETYNLISNLETYLGKKIVRLKAAENSTQDPFDHFYNVFGNYLPSSNMRWCTRYLKLHPFEDFVGDDPVVSYVGIRGDEDREGYISQKPNIQSIFPFRRNIWSQDVINKALKNENIPALEEIYRFLFREESVEGSLEIVRQPVSLKLSLDKKLTLLLDQGVKHFNHVIFEYLKTTGYPLGKENSYPLLEKEEVLIRQDVFNLLKNSGVGVPQYYNEISFEVDGMTGNYARSRSGCYFCFFQQKIEWVWLYEQHPDLFNMAMQYENEKEGFTWNQGESLVALTQPERIKDIKRDFLSRSKKRPKSQYLIDILEDSEEEGCAACFL